MFVDKKNNMSNPIDNSLACYNSTPLHELDDPFSFEKNHVLSKTILDLGYCNEKNNKAKQSVPNS